MKISKVEIQSFRAYDKVKDSTFDFSYKDDIARFISIYAPNGFGKTSFYDAVEWAYTNKIQRFDLRENFKSRLAKSERSQQAEKAGKREKQWIIRNKLSNEDQKGFVRLYTTSAKNPLERTVPDNIIRGGSDYKYDDQVVEPGTEYFHEVILSQEWIDAFLKEDNPEIRYEKFIRSFGDKNLDQHYQTILELIRINKSNIDELRKKIDEIKLDEEHSIEEKILFKFNSVTEEVNKLGENFSLIDPEFTKANIVELSNKLTDRITEIKSDNEEKRKKEKKISIILSGNEKVINLKKYFEQLKLLKSLQGQLLQFKEIKDRIDSRNKVLVEIEKLEKTVTVLITDQEKLSRLIKIFPSYKELLEKKVKETEEIEKKKATISEGEISLKKLKSEENKIESQIATLKKVVQNLQERIEKIPEVFGAIKNRVEEREEISGSLKSDIDLLKDRKEKIEKNLKNVEILKKLQAQIYDSKEFPEYDDNIYVNKFWVLIKDLKDQYKKLAKVKSDISSATAEIEKVDSLNEELSSLIELGSKIVDKEELSKCPLCTQEFESYSMLASSISENPLLEEAKGELLRKRTELEKEFKEKSKTFEDLREEALTKIKQELKETEKTNKNEKKESEELESRINNKEKEIAGLKDIIKDLRLEFDNKSQAESEKKLKEKLKSESESLSKLQTQLKEKKRSVNKLEEKIDYLKKEIDEANKRIIEIEKQKDYKLISNYKKEILLDTDIELEHLKASRDQVKEKIKTNRERVKKLRKELSELKYALISVDEGKVDNDIQKLSKQIDKIKDQINVFELFVELEFGKVLLNKEEKEFEGFLREEKKRLFKALDKNETLKLKLRQLLGYKDNVLPYLEYQEKKKRKEDLREQKKFLKEKVETELKKEKNKLSKFIDRQVESFFYQDLINDLYSKIDPHPDYTNIEFKCDFSGGSPSLNVFVTDNENNQPIAPSLYFSTAQLNILSLSIFLAKALNVKDNDGNSIDCIFIDDPIQSMDSINILSTIDLFRSIIVNLDKQIILSTHDENFQSLLKKKIPTNLFKSKFFELETFGKVKLDQA